MYIELVDPFETDPDAMPCWSGDHSGMGTGLDALEPGDYAVRDENGIFWIVAVFDQAAVIFGTSAYNEARENGTLQEIFDNPDIMSVDGPDPEYDEFALNETLSDEEISAHAESLRRRDAR